MSAGLSTQRTVATAVLLALVGAGIYLNALDSPFVLDDFAAVTENRGARWPVDCDAVFGRNYWGNRAGYEKLTIYRPLATLTFALTDAVANGDDPAVHRVVNMGLHAACTILVFLLGLALLSSAGVAGEGPSLTLRVLRERGMGGWGAFLAALLFALHPVHTEAVIGIVNRAELMAALFVLLGAWVYLLNANGGRGGARPWFARAVVWAIFALALLSKENGFTLWGVIIGVDLVRLAGHRRENASLRHFPMDLWLHVGLALVFAGYMLLRGSVLSGLLAGDLSAADNPMVSAGFLGRWLTPFKVFFWYLRLLVVPVHLTIDYSVNHLPAVNTFLDAEALAGLVLFGGAVGAAAVCAWRSGRDGRAFGVGVCLFAFLATYSVVSNLAFLSTIIMAERLVYLPSGFFLIAAVSAGWHALESAGSRWAGVAGLVTLAVVCGLFAWRTVDRNAEWESAGSLYEAAVEAAPDSAKSRHLLARELSRAGRLEEAGAHFSVAVAIDPANFVARTNYARTLAKAGNVDLALEHLKAALTQSPGYRPAFNLVCAIYERTGRPPAARKYCFRPGHRPHL